MFSKIKKENNSPSLQISHPHLPIKPILCPPTLPLRNMNIPRRGASESRPTNRTLSLGHDARFLALVPEQVTEC